MVNRKHSEINTVKHKKIQGEFAALTAAAAAIHQETRQLSSTADKISQRLEEVEEKAAEIQEMAYELFEQSRRQHLMQMAQTRSSRFVRKEKSCMTIMIRSEKLPRVFFLQQMWV